MQEKFIVLKFDGSALKCAADVSMACHEIYRRHRDGYRVVVMASTVVDSIGESSAAALIGTALDRIGVRTRVLDPAAIAVRTNGAAMNGGTASLDGDGVTALFSDLDVLITPCILGYDAESTAPHHSLASITRSPTRVILLGLGTVGSGVLAHLSAMPSHFEVVGVLVRQLTPQRSLAVRPSRLFADPGIVSRLDADVVIDTLSDSALSAVLISDALARGVDVVTANKRAVIESHSRFEELAHVSGATLRHSAAVGGGAPMLEAVDRARSIEPIRSIEGVLNGTCNFLLHQLDLGKDWNSAICLAQSLGFAEADPSEDISGRDAERKLRILTRQAFAKDLCIDEWDALEADRVSGLRGSSRSGSCIRLIAKATLTDDRVHGSIKLEAIDTRNPFASLQDEWNGLLITGASGKTHWVAGRGAGRWPTSESVIADLWDLRSIGASNIAFMSSRHSIPAVTPLNPPRFE